MFVIKINLVIKNIFYTAALQKFFTISDFILCIMKYIEWMGAYLHRKYFFLCKIMKQKVKHNYYYAINNYIILALKNIFSC
jgi:hypothetical protein